MMQVIKDNCYKGTRVILGGDKRKLIDELVTELLDDGFKEISLPVINLIERFHGELGKTAESQMYKFTDITGRDMCIAPEYTSVMKDLASTAFRNKDDVKLFYVGECFRCEDPGIAKYRQFTQLGVEILNPSMDYSKYMIDLAYKLVSGFTGITFYTTLDVKRDYSYYKDGRGFEITCSELGTERAICGGGEYEGGIGFAFGVDRLLLLTTVTEHQNYNQLMYQCLPGCQVAQGFKNPVVAHVIGCPNLKPKKQYLM